jgi:hypothetical protein
MIIIRRRAAHARGVMREAAAPRADVTLVPKVRRGWVDIESEVRILFREFGRVDATSLDDMVSPWRCSP